jgi:hypothetical protein
MRKLIHSTIPFLCYILQFLPAHLEGIHLKALIAEAEKMPFNQNASLELCICQRQEQMGCAFQFQQQVSIYVWYAVLSPMGHDYLPFWNLQNLQST